MRTKKAVSVALTLILAFQIFTQTPLAEASASLTAPSAVILDPASNKIIFSRAPHRKQPPASTAKIVTALVILDSLSLDHWVTVSPQVEKVEASKLYLNGGDRLRTCDLLQALLMNSANDAASALAIEVSGSERTFAELMTRKARALGARNTRFVNASGLPAEGQYSTAYDLALIMREAMENSFIVSILRQKNTSVQAYNGKRFYLKSHNKMLWRRQKVIGKTGWTRRAKYCFVGVIEEGRHDAVVAVLGSRKLWGDLSALVNKVPGASKNRSTLSYGVKGEEVKRLQLSLKQAGFFVGPATGYFGKKTKQAVLKFQRSRGLSADGIVGIQTRRALAPNP